MANSCCFCALQNADQIPTNTLIIEAIQKITQSILIKEANDKLRDVENQTQLNSVTVSLEKLNAAHKELTKDHEKLNNILVETQRRADSYKQKFLEVQESLIKIHKTNKELSTSSVSKANAAKKFPFSLQETEKKKQVILAPDTCATDAPWEEEEEDVVEIGERKTDLFVQPSPASIPIGKFFKPIKRELNNNPKISKNAAVKLRNDVGKNIKIEIDPDETYCDVPQDTNEEMDDKDFSIPPSPILSGMINLSRRKVEKKDDLEDQGRRSPSLLTSANMLTLSPSRLLAMKQTTLSQKINHPNSKENLKSAPSTSEFRHNDSLSFNHIKGKPRSLSPIQFEDDPEFENEMANHNPCTSFDELFDKTEGILPDVSMDATNVVVIADDLDETRFDLATKCAVEEESVIISDDEHPTSKKICSENDFTTRRMDNSFDFVPKKRSEFKFQSVVRKRDEREKLDAKTCEQCEAYYSDLPDEERAKAIRDICRHRHEYVPPSTPKHFWELGIPSTAECKKRGYIVEKSDLPSEDQEEISNRRRRRRPFEARFSKKKN